MQLDKYLSSVKKNKYTDNVEYKKQLKQYLFWLY